jgi:L-asparagine transporter-like permease
MTTSGTEREAKPVNHRAYGIALIVAFLCMVFGAMGAQQSHQPQSPLFQLIFWVIVGHSIWVTVQARRAKARAEA